MGHLVIAFVVLCVAVSNGDAAEKKKLMSGCVPVEECECKDVGTCRASCDLINELPVPKFPCGEHGVCCIEKCSIKKADGTVVREGVCLPEPKCEFIGFAVLTLSTTICGADKVCCKEKECLLRKSDGWCLKKDECDKMDKYARDKQSDKHCKGKGDGLICCRRGKKCTVTIKGKKNQAGWCLRTSECQAKFKPKKTISSSSDKCVGQERCCREKVPGE